VKGMGKEIYREGWVEGFENVLAMGKSCASPSMVGIRNRTRICGSGLESAEGTLVRIGEERGVGLRKDEA
jgi:hypothetical protein